MGEDLHADERDGLESMVDYVDELAGPRDNFDAIDEDLLVGGGGGGGGGVNNSSIFYGDFPPLPDFPCMSSSSSSSSTPAPLKGTTSMTSCSSTSSTSSSSASSYSAASWAVLKSDADELDHVDKKPSQLQHHHHHHPQSPSAALLSTASMGIIHQTTDGERGIEDGACMDVMETFGYMDLMENSDIWDDPSSIFENPLDFQHQQQQHQLFQQLQSPSPSASSSQQIGEEQQDHTVMLQGGSTSTTTEDQGGGGVQGETSEDLAMVFFEWLKSNKESISAEDLRKIRLKRSTIECAAKRLGGGKEGMKRLLKLILEWVQNHQLHQGKRMREEPEGSQFHNYQFHQDPFPHNIPNPNPNPNLTNQNCTNSMVPPPDQNPCFSTSPWNISHPPPPQPPPYMANPAATAAMAAGPGFSSMVGYMGEPLVNGNPYPPTNDYHHHHHVLDTPPTWPPSSPYAMPSQYNPFPDNHIPPRHPPPPPQAFAGYGNPYTYQHFPGNGEKLVRLGSSATKEARQKRMARQRRFLSHHRHSHNHHSHQQDQQHNQIVADQHARLIGSDNCTSAESAQANPANWVYWPSAAGPISSPPPGLQPDAPVQSQPLDRTVAQLQTFQRQERRQGWKPEKNLRFLLQKVLKQSDVGNLGRIVLPKEAETHLPELDARDGISIPMEDIGTSRVWNMRYRFWPNNKSRMYLLENTGEFVRTNGLQEGDFIVIYSDVKCGKYMIRGVKVRQAGPKPETKKSGKGHKNHHHATTKAGNHGASSSSANKANNNNEMKKNEKKSKPTPFTDSMKIDEQMCG